MIEPWSTIKLYIYLRANYTQYILSSVNYSYVEYTSLSYINRGNFIANIF